ncbi:hypothetical protein EBR66_00470 [bacterium]|nr:hypothetical protein [bacterium]
MPFHVVICVQKLRYFFHRLTLDAHTERLLDQKEVFAVGLHVLIRVLEIAMFVFVDVFAFLDAPLVPA